MEPDAENLNFAVSTDALMHDTDWEFVSGTAAPKNVLADFVRQDKVRKAPAESAAVQ